MSEIGEKIAGLWVEDVEPPPGVLGWIQTQCREGLLSGMISKFCESQSEPIDFRKLRVIKADKVIECEIPVMIVDHEGKSPYQIEVLLTVDPTTGKVTRL